MLQPLDNAASLPRPATVGSIALSLRGMANGVHITGRHDYDALDVNVRGGVNANVGGWVDVKDRK